MNSWNPWKVTAITMFVVLAVALVTGIVVAGFTGASREGRSEAPVTTPAAPPRVSSGSPRAPSAPPQSVVPTQAAVEMCNRYAAEHAPQEKTKEVLTDTAIGAVAGAVIGAAGGAIAGGGKGAGKGAAIGGVVGGAGGALYGVNENRKNDERYRAAYAGCMRSKGYAG
jgi:hypothetical protein